MPTRCQGFQATLQPDVPGEKECHPVRSNRRPQSSERYQGAKSYPLRETRFSSIFSSSSRGRTSTRSFIELARVPILSSHLESTEATTFTGLENFSPRLRACSGDVLPSVSRAERVACRTHAADICQSRPCPSRACVALGVR